MQASLYAKFLRKAFLLEQEKLALADAWKGLEGFMVANLPNGFYYIHCKTLEMQNHLLWEEPWTVAGRILQLSPWRESFQPAFESLSTAAFESLLMASVWIQIYHLPMKLWGVGG